MAKFERVKDKWKELRKNLYGNVEPEVKLEAVTIPVFKDITAVLPEYEYLADVTTGEPHVSWRQVEQLPAMSAGVSYGSRNKLNSEKAINLNKKLIDLKHMTPLESIQYNIYISGISKACGAQLSRYRHTGHISASLRYQEGQPLFIYPSLDYITDEEDATSLLLQLSQIYSESYKYYYNPLRKMGMHKEDARGVLPVSYATERIMWVNARELRHIFTERLQVTAQWEIRRVMFMVFDLIEPLFPSLFFDIKQEIID